MLSWPTGVFLTAALMLPIANRAPEALASTDAAGGVSVAEYDLGDSAFEHEDLSGPVEVRATVHYPTDLAAGPFPVVFMVHGLWTSCADAAAQAAFDGALAERGITERDLYSGVTGPSDEAPDEIFELLSPMAQWPCPDGVPAMRSDRGYGYLAEELGAHGIVVVSISADGLNSLGVAGGPRARVALLNEHVRMWSELATGSGPLVDAVVDQAGTAVGTNVGAALDLSRVGTLGHSRGADAVMTQASVAHLPEIPEGVTVRAVVGLGTPFPNIGVSEDLDQYAPAPDIPFVTMYGTCDRGGFAGSSEADYIFEEAATRNEATIRNVRLPGGNHNFFNTIWSPEGGVPGAYDDEARFGTPAADGYCTSVVDGATAEDVRLTEAEQRTMTTEYVVAFFDRYLNDVEANDALLDGQAPLAGVPVQPEVQVDVPA